MTDIYSIPVTTLDGSEQTLAPYRGQVMLIVNTASQCGFTPQYAGLETLHRELGPKGLAVLGFNLLGDGLRDVLDPRLRGQKS